jgi:glutaredoxin
MIEITLVSPTNCPNCEKVKESIERLKTRYPQIEVKLIDAYSPEGEGLVLQHGIMTSPGILINDVFIGAGNVTTAKIEDYIAKGAA